MALEAGTQQRWLHRGEDWAECLVHVVAQNLGLPSVCTSLALRDNKRGVLIHTFLKNGQELEHGNELLAKAIKGYDSSTEREYKVIYGRKYSNCSKGNDWATSLYPLDCI